MTVTPRRRTQRERVEESSQRLLESAVRLIADQGFDRTTTAQISADAGLSNSMVHMRYGSKESLLEALLRTYENRMFESSSAPDDEGLAQLLGQVNSVRDQLAQQPQLLRAFFMIQFEIPATIPNLKSWLVDWLDRYVDHIADTIRRGQADGSVRRDLAPETEAKFFLSTGVGLGFQWILNPDNVDFDAELSHWHECTKQRFAADPKPRRRRRS